MSFKNIILEKKNRIATITLNRPDKLNSIDKNTHLEIQEALADIENDDEMRVVIITAAGIKAFCTGGDLAYAKSILGDQRMEVAIVDLWHVTCNAVQNLSKPVIAAVNGMALAGGLELMEACDLAIASEDAQLGDQHANYGMVPGGGGTQRLPRLIGIRKAKELLLTGDWISAKEAEAIGLINKAVPADKLMEAANELAAKLAERSMLASAAIKFLVNEGMQNDIETALQLERWVVQRHTIAPDWPEGVNAFLERRKPDFKGKRIRLTKD
ncbi:enoyl-CoA hydratase/isomerase family protein [Chloroflexota bacterium]